MRAYTDKTKKAVAAANAETAGLTPAAQTASKAHAKAAARKAETTAVVPATNGRKSKVVKEVAPVAPPTTEPVVTAADAKAEAARVKAEIAAARANHPVTVFLNTIGHPGVRGDYACALNKVATLLDVADRWAINWSAFTADSFKALLEKARERWGAGAASRVSVACRGVLKACANLGTMAKEVVETICAVTLRAPTAKKNKPASAKELARLAELRRQLSAIVGGGAMSVPRTA